MKELKFKIWIPKSNRMGQIRSVQIVSSTESNGPYVIDVNNNLYDSNDVVFLQYLPTYLNGVRLCEGDVLKIDLIRNRNNKEENHTHYCKIYFEKSAFVINFDWMDFDKQICPVSEALELLNKTMWGYDKILVSDVGNIYENPELNDKVIESEQDKNCYGEEGVFNREELRKEINNILQNYERDSYDLDYYDER